MIGVFSLLYEDLLVSVNVAMNDHDDFRDVLAVHEDDLIRIPFAISCFIITILIFGAL